MARSRQQWVEYMKALALSVDSELDVDFGDINGVFIQPQSIALSQVDAESNRLAQTLNIDNYNLMTDAEFAAFIGNYLMKLYTGTKATGIVYFQATDVLANIVIPKGFPVATDPGSYGQSIVFYTTETQTMVAATKAVYYNALTQLYEIGVAAECTALGATGKVPAGAVKIMQRSLTGISKVYNKTAISSGGVDAETRERAIRRGKSFLKSSGALSLNDGLGNALLEYVEDALVLDCRDANFTRTSEETGAVDAYIVGQEETQVTEYYRVAFTGEEPTADRIARYLSYQPVTGLDSIFIAGVDETAWFTLLKDIDATTPTEFAGSTRGKDALQVNAANWAAYNLLVGEYAVISYRTNQLVRNLQAEFDAADKRVAGRDLCIKEASESGTYIEFTLTVLSGYSHTALASTAALAVYDYVNTLGIGDELQQSDVNFVVRSLTGVDNVVFTNFRLTTEVAGTVHDVVPSPYQYLTIDSANIVVN